MAIITRNNVFFLLRFFVVAAMYFLSVSVFEEEFILDYKFFAPLLALYLIMIIISFVAGEKKSSLIKVVTDMLFNVVFLVETVWLVRRLLKTPDKSGIVFIIMFQYIPVFLLFIIWLRKDILSFDKFSHVVRAIISFFFIAICLFFISLICYHAAKFKDLFRFFNLIAVVPFFVVFIIWLVRDLRDLRKAH